MAPTFDLDRFVRAQDPVYDAVRRELGSGRKVTHWMWFVFPQLAGLGHSPTARLYAISGRAEAVAYLAHPVLGARLRECVALASHAHPRTATDIFGEVDALKYRSCLTLFGAVAPAGEATFADALRLAFAGEADARTIALLEKPAE